MTLAPLLASLALAAYASPRCAARLASNEFKDERLARAVDRLFQRAPGGPDPGSGGPDPAPGGAALKLVRERKARKPGSFTADVRADRVLVAAVDEEGAFRGLAAAAGRCSAGALKPGRLDGEPAFGLRGVLEGFYGRPWTWAQRRAMVDWMSRRRMNLFVIAPKDDPSLRDDWRRPMSSEERGELKKLVDWAHERFVEVAWSLSPGLDLEPSSPGDLDAAKGKIEAAGAAGVRRLVIAFDDVDPSRSQVRFANRLLEGLAPRLPGADWIFVPAVYWGDAAPSSYLRTVARELDRRYAVGWTGGQVLARRIAREEAEAFGSYIQHRLVLGDNYPAQDRLWGAGRLFFGPLRGRAPGLDATHAAFVVNASPLPAASRVPLATAAEYAWDPAGYDPAGAWNRAVAEEGARGPAFERFASYNEQSWLDPGEEPGAVDALEAELEAVTLGSKPSRALRKELATLSRLRADLGRELKGDPELLREIEPWAEKLESQARAAQAAMDRDERADGAARDADALEAVVAGQALDRFVHGRLAEARGLPAPDPRPVRERIAAFAAGRPGARLALAAALDRLAGGPALVRRAGGPSGRLWLDAMPWVPLLADAADRARPAVDGALPGGPRAWWSDRAWKWRARSSFIALAAGRTLLEDYLSRTEASWKGGVPRPLPWSLKFWLWLESKRAADSLPARLYSALDAEGRGDPRGLARLFEELSLLPALTRERLPGQLAEEGSPWLDKVGDYGKLGLLALELRAHGRAPADAERARWDEARYRLRSSNGLELALELKLDLDASVAWSRLPAATRPPVPQRRLPADPREML